MSRTHACLATGCETVIRVKHAFCHEHWQILPTNLQNAVNSERFLWEETGSGDHTAAHTRILIRATEYLKEKENPTDSPVV